MFAVGWSNQNLTIMKTTDKKERCEPCDQSFGEKIKEIVDDVKNYTRKEYRNRKKEVEAAFSTRKK